MFQKPRKTATLLIFESLKKRSTLTTEQQKTYRRLSTGFIGEQKFAERIERELRNEPIKLFGLQLEIDGNEFQIDSTLIFQQQIHLIEIKNHGGDYLFENDNWYTITTKKPIKNPLHQLNRCNVLFHEFLHQYNTHLNLTSRLVYMNHEFHLYNSQPKIPIVFPGQIDRLIRTLNQEPCNLNASHHKLAERLKSAHIEKSKYEILPEVNYEDVRKGITCANCDGFMVSTNNRRNLSCSKCKISESTDQAIIRNIDEFHFLFPKRDITNAAIVEWCGGGLASSQIRRILRTKFEIIKRGRYAYYA